MSFRIVEIIDTRPEGTIAKVSHQNNQLTVIVPGKRQDDLPVGMSFDAEIGFDRVLDWKIIDDFNDEKSGIWQVEDGIHLLGRIHSLVDFGDGRTMIDVYLRNGPEFLKLDLETIGDETFESDTGLEVRVGNVYLYPLIAADGEGSSKMS